MKSSKILKVVGTHALYSRHPRLRVLASLLSCFGFATRACGGVPRVLSRQLLPRSRRTPARSRPRQNACATAAQENRSRQIYQRKDQIVPTAVTEVTKEGRPRGLRAEPSAHPNWGPYPDLMPFRSGRPPLFQENSLKLADWRLRNQFGHRIDRLMSQSRRGDDSQPGDRGEFLMRSPDSWCHSRACDPAANRNISHSVSGDPIM